MKRNNLLLFYGIFVVFNLAANFAHPVTPAFIVDRHLDSSMFGVAIASMMVMNFLFSPLWGKLCNYIPTKRIMMICCIGYSIGQFLFLIAYSETMVVLARMFAGIFTGGAFTSFSNYVINIAADSRERDSNLTVLVTVQNVSSACGYFLGGMMGLISTEFSIIAQVVLLAVGGLLFLPVCLDDTPFKHKPENSLTISDINPFRAFITVQEYLTPMLLLIFAIVAVSAIGQNSYEQCFNYFIKDQYGMSSAYNGTFKGLIALMTLLINSTVCVYLQKKTDINKTFLYILFACTMLIAAILIWNNQILFVATYIIYSSVNVARLPLMQSMIASRSTPESRNSLMGLNQSMNSLGGIFGAMFAGLIYERGPMLPFILAFLTYGGAGLLGILYVIRYRREKMIS